MRRILLIAGGTVALLTVLGVATQPLHSLKIRGMLREYDRAIQRYAETNDLEAVYYELNHLHNRIATCTGGRKHLTAEQIKWIGRELDRRAQGLLALCEQEMPDGIPGDWATLNQLECSPSLRRVAVLSWRRASCGSRAALLLSG